MTVTRYHLVKADSKTAIDIVKDCGDEAEYLHSCDELDYDGEIEYEIQELDDEWTKDQRLAKTARYINERLSQEKVETDLTKRRKKRIIKGKKSPPGKMFDSSKFFS